MGRVRLGACARAGQFWMEGELLEELKGVALSSIYPSNGWGQVVWIGLLSEVQHTTERFRRSCVHEVLYLSGSGAVVGSGCP